MIKTTICKTIISVNKEFTFKLRYLKKHIIIAYFLNAFYTHCMYVRISFHVEKQ